MKTSLSTFALLTAFLCTILVTGCKKGTDPMPNAELSARVVGNYTFASVTTGGKTYPASQTQLAGGVVVTRESATGVSVQLDIHSKANEPFLQGSVTGITLTDAGNNEVNLVKDGDQVAKGGNGKLTIKVTDSDGAELDITVTK